MVGDMVETYQMMGDMLETDQRCETCWRQIR